MAPRWKAFNPYLPGAALGLFCGRILSEFLPPLIPQPVLNALLLTLPVVILFAFLLSRHSLARTWPAFILLAYVFYPTPNPYAAGVVALTALLVWAQILLPSKLKLSLQADTAVALIISLLFFFLYLATLAPDILPADNGEFQLIAAQLGIAHPPGFPLYTLLAHLMTRLPFDATPAYKVNLLSAISSAVTLFLVYLTTLRLTRRHLAALTAVITLATAATFWAQATTANIRSLTALFAAWMLFALIGFYQASQTGKDQRSADHYLVLFALSFGLGITHHASLAFMGLIFLLFILLVGPSLLRTPRRWIRPLLALLLGLLPLLYLPLRAGVEVRGAAPGLATWSGFWNHVLALGFRGDLFYYTNPAALWERLKIMGNVMSFQFAPLLLAGMLLGVLLLLRCDWRLAFLLGGSWALHTFITAAYRAPQTVEYMLPAYVSAVICLGAAVGWLQDMDRRADFWGKVGVTLAALLLAAALWQSWSHFPSYDSLHTDTTARDYAAPLLQDAPPDSVILADWHWATPLWYLQEVEGQRPDVSVRFVFPAGEAYGQTWAQRIQAELENGRLVISTHFDSAAYASLPLSEPLHETLLFRQTPRQTPPDDFSPLELVLGDAIQLLGYQLTKGAVASGAETSVTLAWQPLDGYEPGLALFAHLVGPDGQIVAQQDLPAAAQPDGVTLTRFYLTPRLQDAPGDYALLVGAYGAEALLNDREEERTAVATITLLPSQTPPVTQQATYRTMVENGRRLVGYDWDNTLPGQPRLYLHWQSAGGYQTETLDTASYTLPPWRGPWGIPLNNSDLNNNETQFYVPFGQGIVWRGAPLDAGKTMQPGEALTLAQNFLSSRPVLRDYAVSVRLIGFEADGFHWAWWDLDDSIPAMGAMPTLKWISGSAVRAPHFVSVDAEAPAGQQIGAALTLYETFTERPLPILDERITQKFAWLPLGESRVAEK